MENLNNFSAQRFILLMRRFITLHFKTWLTGIYMLSSLLVLLGLLNTYINSGQLNTNLLILTGHTVIFLGGLVLSSMAFNELHYPTRSQFLLTLPATTFEKLFSHWLVTSLIFIVFAHVVLAVTLALVGGICHVIWGSAISFYNPFAMQSVKVMGTYMVAQSIFFLGAVYFRKNNFLKTALSLFVINTALSIIIGLFMVLVFKSAFIGIDTTTNPINPQAQVFFETTLPWLNKIFLGFVLTPFCLVVAYFRLKEREV